MSIIFPFVNIDKAMLAVAIPMCFVLLLLFCFVFARLVSIIFLFVNTDKAMLAVAITMCFDLLLFCFVLYFQKVHTSHSCWIRAHHR